VKKVASIGERFWLSYRFRTRGLLAFITDDIDAFNCHSPSFGPASPCASPYSPSFGTIFAAAAGLYEGDSKRLAQFPAVANSDELRK
jgi:hypothetical protein